MRAGSLDRQIVIEEPTTEIDEYRTPNRTWSIVARVGAQIVQHDTVNHEGAHTTTETAVTFRIYWRPDITLENRVRYQNQPYKIQKIREIGRRAGLDLVVERVGP
jgi:head-tail adaptor